MKKKEYYLQLSNGIVVGYHSDPIDPDNLPEGEEIVKVATDTPENYIGLTKCQIFLDPLPVPPSPEPVINRANKIINEVKNLCCLIEALKLLGECTAVMEHQRDELRIEYQIIKSKEQVLPLNF